MNRGTKRTSLPRPRARGGRADGVARLEVVGSGQRALAGVGLWPWVDLAGRHGLALEQLAVLMGVPASELRDPDARFDQAVANRLAEIVCDHVGPDAGLAAALLVERGQFALFELLARTAPSVGVALTEGARWFALIHSDLCLRFDARAEGAHELRVVLPATYEVHRGYVELLFGALLVGLRRETGEPSIAPIETWFRQPAPADRGLYERVFGRVQFDMAEDRMLFARSVIERALSRPNAEIHAAAVRSASALVHD